MAQVLLLVFYDILFSNCWLCANHDIFPNRKSTFHHLSINGGGRELPPWSEV